MCGAVGFGCVVVRGMAFTPLEIGLIEIGITPEPSYNSGQPQKGTRRTTMSNAQSKLIFWVAFIGAQVGGFIIFKDLADISQWIVQSPREFTMAVWYNRYAISAVSIALLLIASWLWLKDRKLCPKLVFIPLFFMFVINFYSGMINVGFMFRSQQYDATFVPVEEAPAYLQKSLKYAHFGEHSYDSIDDISMMVLEADNGVYAYSDYYLLQPHVVKGDTVNGEEVVMTYCGMTNLGVAYSPVIGDQKLELRATTQLKNNLVLADSNTGEPIQQIWGHLEGEPEKGSMKEFATVRMPFRTYRELYPEGLVYINEIGENGENALLALWDRVVRNGMMYWGVGLQWNQPDKGAFPTIKDPDPRLPMKELVQTVSVAGDHVAYTKAFLGDQGGLVNVEIGGRDVVINYDGEGDVVSAFFNDSGAPIAKVDPLGRILGGQRLERVNTLKSDLFWFIFAEFYPTTDVNRA